MMKISTYRLANALSRLTPVGEMGSSLQNLSAVFLRWDGGDTLWMGSQSLQSTASLLLSVDNTDGQGKPFDVAIQAKQILQIVKEWPGEVVDLLVENGMAIIKGQYDIFRLCTFAGTDYQKLDAESSSDFEFSVHGDSLSGLVSAAVKIADPQHHSLSTVLLDFTGDDSFVVVGCDGKRLSVSRPLPFKSISGSSESLKQTRQVLIPMAQAEKMGALLKGTGPVQISIAGPIANISVMGFASKELDWLNAVSFCVRLSHEDYPAYRQVIPSSEGKEGFVVNSERFLSSIKRSILANKDSAKQAVHLIPSSKGVGVVSVESSTGDTLEEILEGNATDTPRHTCLDPVLLSDLVKTLDHEKLNVIFDNELEAVLLTPAECSNAGLAVIMPLRESLPKKFQKYIGKANVAA